MIIYIYHHIYIYCRFNKYSFFRPLTSVANETFFLPHRHRNKTFTFASLISGNKKNSDQINSSITNSSYIILILEYKTESPLHVCLSSITLLFSSFLFRSPSLSSVSLSSKFNPTRAAKRDGSIPKSKIGEADKPQGQIPGRRIRQRDRHPARPPRDHQPPLQ